MLANHRASRAFALSALVAGVAISATARASGEGTAPQPAVQPDVAAAGLVISQVYGGGGNANASYQNDFVELFNAGTTAIAASSVSLQYAMPTSGTWAVSSLDFNKTGATIPAGGYYLVEFNVNVTGTVGAALPAVDDGADTDLGQASGKIALVTGSGQLSCTSGGSPNACAPGTANPTVLDLVGWGTALDYEGTAAVGTLSSTKAAIRNLAGCTQTLSNVADFTVSAPTPRNSSQAKITCGTTPPITDAGTDGGSTTPTAGSLVISQVYGGYNYFDSTYDQNFVELFNRGGSAISLSGYSVQTASATTGFGAYSDGGAEAADIVALPSVMVPAGGYYLVGLTAGTDAGAALPTVDTSAMAYLNYKSGKVALVQGTTALGCGTATNQCAAGTYVDIVGYGTPSQSEGMAPAPQLGDALAAQRAGMGCTDTNNNAADFTAGVPAARDSKTPVHLCSGGTTSPSRDGGATSDSGTSGRDASTGDDDDDDNNGDDDDDDSLGNPDASTGGINEVSDANSGGCSTHGRSSGAGEAVGFGLFAAAIVLFVRRRRNRR